MELETKYLRLRTPVTLGSRFGEWQVRWLGGWNTDRLFYLVMLVKLRAPIDYAPMPGSRLAFKASNLRILCHAQNPESTIHREETSRMRLIAKDEKVQRVIIGIGEQRIAYDFHTRITHLSPETGDQPAEILPMRKTPKQAD